MNNSNNEDSRLIAACLKCLRLGADMRDLTYLQAWFARAHELMETGGSHSQKIEVETYRSVISDIEVFEAAHGKGSAQNPMHPVVTRRWYKTDIQMSGETNPKVV